MESRPYKMLNTSELSEIEKQVNATWNAWAGAWLPGDGRCEATCSRAAEANVAESSALSRWMRLGSELEQWLSLSCSPAFYSQLGRSLVPGGRDGTSTVVDVHGSALLTNLMKSALNDFLQQLYRGKAGHKGEIAREAAAPAARFWQAGSGAAVVTLAWGDTELAVVIGPGLAASMLAGLALKAPRKATLAKPRDVIGNSRLSLKVVVGEAHLELGLLQTIVAGDVIKLNTRIDQPLHVVNASGTPLCRAFLGSHDGRKSIQLTV